MKIAVLDLVLAPGYMYIMRTGLDRGFAASRVDDRSERVSFIEYMVRLRRETLMVSHAPLTLSVSAL